MEKIVVDKDSAGLRLDKFLRLHFKELPQSLLQKWERKGALRINDIKCQVKTRVAENDEVSVPTFQQKESEPKIRQPSKDILQDFKKRIIFENEDLIVINKPAGLAVQGGSKQTIHIDLILDAISTASDQKYYLVHRIDKDTSGLLLIAKNRISASYLTQLFKDKAVKKTYLALVVGQPREPRGIINLPLSKSMTPKGERVVTDSSTLRDAITKYEVIHSSGQLSLLSLEPLTGRTHQLRAHCQYGLSTPILGDGKYGGKSAHPSRRESNIFLHAYKLSFPLHSGQLIETSAPLPEYFLEYLNSLKFNL